MDRGYCPWGHKESGMTEATGHACMAIICPNCACTWLFLVPHVDFPGGSDCKASVYNAGDPGSIPRSERSPGEGNGNPLQYYCPENPMDRGAW